MSKNNVAAQLRKEVSRVKGPELGTVVRFELVITAEFNSLTKEIRRYTYAAVFTNNYWYVTGERGFFGEHAFPHSRFVAEVLARKGVENIVVATDFETV